MAYKKATFTESVFVNFPFDDNYLELFRGLIFTVYYCGFFPRTALEDNSATEHRLDKIYSMIEESKYGIHDLSRVELDPDNNLPRFNMPFELGLFLGCNKYSEARNQKLKKCMILDVNRHRFKISLSDIGGIDGYGHENNHEKIIKSVRDWLHTTSRKNSIPSTLIIKQKYKIFLKELPEVCNDLQWDFNDLNYNEFLTIVEEWIDVNKEEI
ncbi:MAG: hypothetical protein GWO78_04880 [Dehalococcoidales bacterium]|jgi:hypothetical protein|nr:hypothetical protein [Flavobacteriales bacterium]NCG35307.1 hypothetical protein [Dehalococcoidales bacterium]